MWVVYAVSAVLAYLFVRKGLARVPKHPRKAALWFGAAVDAVVFSVLATVRTQFVEERGTYKLSQESVRFGVLASGVVVVFAVMAMLLPLALDALERRGFAPFVGARHIRATKSGFLTVISVLSMAGVAVSSCALCSVTSIMGGFGHDLKRKILGNTAHVVIDVRRPGGFGDWQAKLEVIQAAAREKGGAATPVAGGEAMASSDTNTAGALLRGIDPETIGDVINLRQNIEVGRFEYLTEPARLLDMPPDEIIGRGSGGEAYLKGPEMPFPRDPSAAEVARPKEYPGIILGRELAKALHVFVGQELTLLSPTGELGPTGIMPRAKRFRVAAIFYSGMYEYDASHAYVLMADAQRFFSLDDKSHKTAGRITHIDIRAQNPELVGELRPAIDAVVLELNGGKVDSDELGHGDAVGDAEGAGGPKKAAPLLLRVRDWMEMNKNLFSALKLEKVATFVILSIAIAVASFCIICTLLLMVTEKSKEIAILKALGAADGAVMRIFMLEGIIIGAIGTLFGVVSALAICLGLSWTGMRLDPEVYYIDRLPVNVDAGDYSMVAIAALVICSLATIYPAYTAAKIRPVEGLRYE
ncbi:MAG: ABC transporter permease [Polyangiaceae bacterium]|nr:ABC transporter permease [Polyangiaceae bacterium]